ncbi:MAG: hypothetical protein U5K75_05050 [Ahrensia sp.]|nr:hypothetical protein [Ahrensia sp.]
MAKTFYDVVTKLIAEQGYCGSLQKARMKNGSIRKRQDAYCAA